MMRKYYVRLYSGNYLFDSYECDSVQDVFSMLNQFTYDGCVLERSDKSEGLFSFICRDDENECFSKIVVDRG